MRRLLLSALISQSLLSGAIIEISDMKDMLPLLDFSDPTKTMIVFDIDNTLLQAKQQLGSVAWGEHMTKELIKKRVPHDEAKEITNILWSAVQPYIEIEPVLPNTSWLVKDLQTQGATILCLTARAPHEVAYTHRQLKSIGIDLDGTDKQQEFFLNRKVLFYQNILFSTPFNKKSKTLLCFLEHNQLDVNQIVFIDDKYSHVEEVIRALEKKGITCLGIRFSGADQRVAQYNPKISALQWEAFPKILSDEEAEIILQSQNW
ncbi:MAG: hypothetical protein KR126chlam3_01409 [Chlamydiae bacterium]|nr:hypothetical protein [Chlamydiota bacterium]